MRTVTCPECGGTGRVDDWEYAGGYGGPGCYIRYGRYDCPKCAGTGETTPSEAPDEDESTE